MKGSWIDGGSHECVKGNFGCELLRRGDNVIERDWAWFGSA